MNKQKKQTGGGDAKIKLSTLLYGIAIAVIFAFGVACVLAYGTSTEIGARIATGISKVVPFPAAIVDWRHIVFMDDVQANLSSVQQFYQTQDLASVGLRVDFTTEDGKKRLKIKEREIIDKMVEDKIVEILAKKEGVSVSDIDVDNVVSKKLNEFGTANEFKADLAKSYGWTIDDFKKRVVLPGMYSDALAQKVLAQDPDNTKSKEKINQAKSQLDGGKDFAEVARTYSQGSSKDNGGELGWVKKDQVLPELQEVLFGSKALEKNGIIESSIGFHIFEIENRKKEDGQDVLQLRQIFVAKLSYTDWLVQQKKQMSVSVPLRDFFWDSKTGSIEFRDEKMRTFEKDERAKAQGDASITI